MSSRSFPGYKYLDRPAAKAEKAVSIHRWSLEPTITMSAALERLDNFCHPVSNFWVGLSLWSVVMPVCMIELYYGLVPRLNNFRAHAHQTHTHQTHTQWADSSCSFVLGQDSVAVGNHSSCHDEVDFSLCFEDTAILYGICITFWFLAGLSFFRGNGLRPKLDFGPLHASKLVCVLINKQCNQRQSRHGPCTHAHPHRHSHTHTVDLVATSISDRDL